MAYQILWFDGFDEISGLSDKYVIRVEYNENGLMFSGSDVPYGYGRATALNTSSENFVYKLLPNPPYTTLFIAFHWYYASLDSTERSFLQFWDNANNLMQMEVRRIYDGVTGTYLMRLYRGSTLLATTPSGVYPGTWNWISAKLFCDPAAGNFKLNINSVNKLDYTGNTRNGSISQIHRVKLTTGTIMGTDFRIDNLAIATGASTDDPLPDCRVFGGVMPTANDVIAFTPSSGSNWSNVNEIPPNNDTSYNYSSTVGATDTFVGTPPSVSNVIYAVKVNARARKNDAGYRSVSPVVKPTTTVHEGAEQQVTPNYFDHYDIWETNPDTALPWTPSQVSNLKWGYRLKG